MNAFRGSLIPSYLEVTVDLMLSAVGCFVLRPGCWLTATSADCMELGGFFTVRGVVGNRGIGVDAGIGLPAFEAWDLLETHGAFHPE
jgi:hypothetical protein